MKKVTLGFFLVLNIVIVADFVHAADANTGEALLQVEEPTLLYADADQRATYQVRPGQQLLISNVAADQKFLKAALLSPAGDIQLVGYVHRRAISEGCTSVNGLTVCNHGGVNRIPPFRKDPNFHCTNPHARYVGDDKILGGCLDPGQRL